MKALKSVLISAVAVTTISAASVEAAVISYNIQLEHTAYSAVIPGLPQLSAEVVSVQPVLTGVLELDSFSTGAQVKVRFAEPYYNIDFFNGSSDVVATLSKPNNELVSLWATSIYDPVTRTLTASKTEAFLNYTQGVQPFCVGLLAVCAGVFEYASSPFMNAADFDLLLVFDDAERSSFTGRIRYSRTLNNGTFVSGEYTIFAGEVPVPAAAWLFGSAVMGLFGRKLRGSSRSVA